MDANDLLLRIDSAGLSGPVYRTAIRLLMRTHPDNAYARIDYADMTTICETDSFHTARGHLAALVKADLITCFQNGAVHVHWHASEPVDPASARVGRAQMSAGRADYGPESVDGDYKALTADDAPRVGRAPEIAGRAPEIAGRAPPHTRGVCLFVIDHPTTLRNDDEETNKQTRMDEAEQARAVALLTDPEVGVTPSVARRFAGTYRFEYLARHVFEWRRQLTAGTAEGVGALVNRIKRGWGAVCIEADKTTDLYQRHMPAADSEAERRRRYVPDEYADIIIH